MKVDKNEQNWDKLLHIHTMGRDDSRSDQYRYPYEPTPYSVLERLANTGYIRILLVWNMMTGSMQRRWKIKRRLCLAGEYPLRW